MTVALNISDVPAVPEADLGLAMQRLIQQGHGLILLKGASDETRQLIEDAVWETFSASSERRLAVLLRLESLVAVFESRRLRDVFLRHGLLILPHLLHIAAYHRLNVNWGFNPQKVLGQLLAALDDDGAANPPTTALAREAASMAA